MEKLRRLYKQIENDWKIITDESELQIMHKYTEIGRKNVMMYSAYLIVGVSIFLCMPIFAPLLDQVLPLENGKRSKALPYYADYGIDLDEYYPPMITQAVVGGVGTITLHVTFDIGFMMIVQHVVALFELVSYRLSKASEIANLIMVQSNDVLKKNQSIRHLIEQAVDLHQIVLSYVNTIEDCYSIAWMATLFANVMGLGGGFTVLLMKTRPEDLLRYSVCAIALLIHFYFIFLPGQKIINSSTEVFNSCYNCQWYNMLRTSKTLIQIMLLRSLQTCQLTGGKLFVMCMETYCNMMKTGFSLFTILRSSA